MNPCSPSSGTRLGAALPEEILSVINVEAAKALWGEPVYTPMKCYMGLGGTRTNPHHIRRMDWREVPEEEYAEHAPLSQKTEHDRFWNHKRVGSFWLYERRLTKEGWPQKLESALKTFNREHTK